MRPARAVVKIALFLVLALLAIPPQLALLRLSKGPAAEWIPLLWHKAICAVFGIKIEIRGAPEKDRQALYVSNHLSYLDIVVLAGILRASFLSKKEVKSWPFFNILAYLQQTAYIERRKTALVTAKTDLETLLARGRSLIIFPEGTSTDGQSVRRFKSGLFALALEGLEPLPVQPVTISVAEADGRPPESQKDRDLYAWHIDMKDSLALHLWRFAKSSGARLIVTFHEPLSPAAFPDRKALAKACHDSVCKGLSASQTGEPCQP